ncbi:MAG TPA: hypothetical protein ENJ60_05395 [Aeromonadales bacterium]|nr:hypothetical protein [Aeromonadales bacterium]
MNKPEKIFEKLAFTTWETILNAFLKQISYGEDAITSVNLLSLKNEALGNIVLQDTRPKESTKGCDFEFWIGSDEKGWFRYAIQAKKITVSSNRYNSLAHKVNGIPQIDILEKYSLANRAIPIYCLFNYSEKVSYTKTGCPKYKNSKELGCSVTPLKTVREAIKTRGARTFQWFHSRGETLPWSCLVRCPQIINHWPPNKLGLDMKDMMHKKLPEVLHLLLCRKTSEPPPEQYDEKSHSVQLEDSNLFSQQINYRPRWVGVINLEDDKNS